MPVYAKKVKTTDPRFSGRATVVMTANYFSKIPVPDSIVLCDGCNKNIAETEEKRGYLVYLGKRELAKDQPYDFYCEKCLTEYFKGYIEVS